MHAVKFDKQLMSFKCTHVPDLDMHPTSELAILPVAVPSRFNSNFTFEDFSGSINCSDAKSDLQRYR